MVWCYKIGTSEGWLPTEADMLELAEEHALQALRLGPDRGESLTTLGVHVLGRRRFEDALAHAQRGAACDPASSATIANLARCELIAGLPERAALSARRAAALAPRVPPRIWMLLGAGLLMSGQARAALPWLDRAAREVPEFPQARVWQCAGHAAAGQSRSAQAIGQVLLRLHPGFDVGWWTGRGGMFRRERDADLLRDCLRAAGLRTLTAHSRGIGESLRGA
jgi:tetratricopeptide (TPR) repeat protein